MPYIWRYATKAFDFNYPNSNSIFVVAKKVKSKRYTLKDYLFKVK
jgi:hypothetical protein